MKKSFDKVFVYQPSPITVGVPAVILSKLFNKSFYFWVQDLWPASITAAAGIHNKYVISLFHMIARIIYNSSAAIFVQSKAFIPYIINQGIEKRKIKYFPNSTEKIVRKKYENRLRDFNIPEGFNLLFAGNIGYAQSFETLIEAAKILKKSGKKINWIFLGDGRMKEVVIKQIELQGLKDCFFLIGRFPVSEMPSFFSCADALLLSLRRDEIFSYTIPSKLQSYLAFGKPIIASLDGEGAKVIKEANAGFVSPSEDASALASNIILAEETDKNTLELMALSGVAYYEKEFEREKLLTKLEDLLQS